MRSFAYPLRVSAVLLISLALFVQGADKALVKEVDPAAAERLIQEKKVVVLDIRTPKEFNSGHIAGAKNFDFYDKNFKTKIGELDKSKAYLVHCASGGRSGKSMELFEELGFKQIYHLKVGFSGWQKAGKPVEK